MTSCPKVPLAFQVGVLLDRFRGPGTHVVGVLRHAIGVGVEGESVIRKWGQTELSPIFVCAK